MSKKRGNLFEEYIDKIVLGAIAVLSLVLLWVFVLGSPYAKEYSGRKFSPGQIDQYILEYQAGRLGDKLDELPESRSYNQSRMKDFLERVECSIPDISGNVSFPLPSQGGMIVVESRSYLVPEIGQAANVEVEAIRTAVHLPVEEVEMNKPYRDVETELGDVDLITVQASFDVEKLFANFQTSFAGRRVKIGWRDENLAKPVFAAVQLQRRTLLGGDKWGDWQVVPKTKIDHLKEMLDIPEKVADVKYGTDLMREEFDEFEIQKEILQPQAYEIAASNEDWYVPVLHKEYKKLLKEEESKRRREALERKKKESLRGKDDRKDRSRRDTMRGPGGGGGNPMMTLPPAGGRGGGAGRRQPARSTRQSDRRRTTGRSDRDGRDDRDDSRRKVKARTLKDVDRDQEKFTLDEKTKLEKMRKELVFWAHDDTAKAGHSYQYRIRLGVFNPIAGKNWFVNAQKSLKNDVLLWSEYSVLTETVVIPERIYFFPLNVTEGDETLVNVQVSKFHLGKWRSEEFDIRPGEIIGKVVEQKEDEDEDEQTYSPGRGYDKNQDEPETIDFGTETVLVDIVQRNDLVGAGLRTRDYAEVLYSNDDVEIGHLAVKSKNWPTNLQKEYSRIKEAESEEIEIFYARGRSERKYTPERMDYPPEGMPGVMPPGGMPPPMFLPSR